MNTTQRFSRLEADMEYYRTIQMKTERRARIAGILKTCLIVSLYVASAIGIALCVRIKRDTDRQIKTNDAIRQAREIRNQAADIIREDVRNGREPDGLARMVYWMCGEMIQRVDI